MENKSKLTVEPTQAVQEAVRPMLNSDSEAEKAPSCSQGSGADEGQLTETDTPNVEVDEKLTGSFEALSVNAPRRPNYSAAARRRYGLALRQGKSKEEAALIAAEARPAENRNPSTTGTATAVKDSHKKEEGYRVSYSQVLDAVKLGIKSKEEPFGEEETKRVKKAIEVAMRQNKGDVVQPEFESISSRSGWMQFNCTNQTTAAWLREEFGNIKTTCGLDIELLEADDFPKDCTVQAFLRDCTEDSNKEILEIIQSQNNLPATEWAVKTRYTEDRQEHLILGIDQESWNRLVAKGGRIAFKFGHTRLMMGKKRNAGVLADERMDVRTTKDTQPATAEGNPPKKQRMEKRREETKNKHGESKSTKTESVLHQKPSKVNKTIEEEPKPQEPGNINSKGLNHTCSQTCGKEHERTRRESNGQTYSGTHRKNCR